VALRDYTFTDPLGSPAAPGTGTLAAQRARRTSAALYVSAALVLGLILVLPDPDHSDHLPLGIVALVSLALGLTYAVWRRPPGALLVCSSAFGVLIVAASVAAARPLAGTAFFALWPMIGAACFLQRREVLATFGLLAGAYAVVFPLWVDDTARTLMAVSTLSAVAGMTCLVFVLKHRVVRLVAGLERAAATDPLTGMLNRGAFADAVSRHHRERTGPYAVLVLDLDEFKSINDRFGHDAGDLALRRFGVIAAAHIRPGDVLARVGGEEFALLLPGTDAHAAGQVAERIRAAVEVGTTDLEGRVTVSVGIAHDADGMRATGDVLRDADRALYRAKAAGRNRVVTAA
jgi:diguanylate cyclase (GGDEF)-like protein